MVSDHKINVLFVTHKKSQCGVYEFGSSVYDAISLSAKYHFIKAECGSLEEFNKYIKENTPTVIIYNYHPTTMPWLTGRSIGSFKKSNIGMISAIQIGIIHEVTQELANAAIPSPCRQKGPYYRCNNLTNSLFDYYIAADPTLLLKNPIVFKTGRIIPQYHNNFELPDKTVIGSAGFGTVNKGFDKVVKLVQEEFDCAEIRINIPFADYADNQGQEALKYVEMCKKEVFKPGIELNITHEFKSKCEFLDFLAQNTINVFLYEDQQGRGISSALDNAMAVDRPIAISDSIMFRHMFDTKPSICIKDNSLRKIIENGTAPLAKYKQEWTAENLLWNYERILDKCLSHPGIKVNSYYGILKQLAKSIVKKILRKTNTAAQAHNWLRDTSKLYEDDYYNNSNNINYDPIKLPDSFSLNGILDKKAFAIYKQAIDKMIELVPNTMAKKIAAANVNQGFVFDTVLRYISDYTEPKILCIGAYEDTACMSLIKIGYTVDEIDPMINYYLQEYFTKPNVAKESYDIIFSTSVIEHDPDDKAFIKCVSELLKPGGVFIMTCDFKNGWKKGDAKPNVDERLYTQQDLSERLISYMNKCQFVDTPDWQDNITDFEFENVKYTFASFVVRKDT